MVHTTSKYWFCHSLVRIWGCFASRSYQFFFAIVMNSCPLVDIERGADEFGTSHGTSYIVICPDGMRCRGRDSDTWYGLNMFKHKFVLTAVHLWDVDTAGKCCQYHVITLQACVVLQNSTRWFAEHFQKYWLQSPFFDGETMASLLVEALSASHLNYTRPLALSQGHDNLKVSADLLQTLFEALGCAINLLAC